MKNLTFSEILCNLGERFYLKYTPINPVVMRKPSEIDFKKAKKMLHSENLDYETAILCCEIMKGYLNNERIPLIKIINFQKIQYMQNRVKMTR